MTHRREPPIRPAGEAKTTWRATLEAGARLLQDTAPLRDFDIYVAGFHCAKHEPSMHMEAHHFCKQVNSDFIQCTIFDGNTRDANLIGIEYIISEQLFGTLPEEEKPYWHPHNFEVFSGTLIAPGLPQAAEHALMALLVNSYGKTWHTWHTGRHDGHAEPGHPLPLGDAKLMWSFNRDGEVDAALEEEFNAAMGVDQPAKRANRRDLLPRARPQRGVDALRNAFPGSRPIEGVVDVDAAPEMEPPRD